MKLKAKDIYLDTLSRENCRMLWNDLEYDLENPAEEVRLGLSDEQADAWFEEIQKLQGSQNVRMGIFLLDGAVIGEVALQELDLVNRKCSVGMTISKLENRSRGYGQQAVRLMIDYGFRFLGMERITASTLAVNAGAQRSLEKCGFQLEGREREAIYRNGRKFDQMNYAILKRDYESENEIAVSCS